MSQQPPRPSVRREPRPLLSVCTILILSGFLIGMTAGRNITEELQPFILAAGMVGVLAFVALDHVALQKRIREEVMEQQIVEGRLSRHCESLRESAEFGALSLPTMDEESAEPASVATA